MSARLQQTVTIVNMRGLHVRASAKVQKLASGFDATLQLQANGETADATSILDLLMLGAGKGDTVLISASGPQAEAALAAVSALFAAGFDETD